MDLFKNPNFKPMNLSNKSEIISKKIKNNAHGTGTEVDMDQKQRFRMLLNSEESQSLDSERDSDNQNIIEKRIKEAQS